MQMWFILPPIQRHDDLVSGEGQILVKYENKEDTDKKPRTEMSS